MTIDAFQLPPRDRTQMTTANLLAEIRESEQSLASIDANYGHCDLDVIDAIRDARRDRINAINAELNRRCFTMSSY